MPEQPLEWRVAMGTDRPGGRVVAGLAIILAGVAGFVLFHSVVAAVLGVGLIFASTAELWLGFQYRLDEKGASSRKGMSVTTLPWSDVKRIMVSDSGVTLSPLERASRLDEFRGVFLRPGDLGKERLLDAIHEYGGEHVREMG
jgi:hypothetical protein